jgi:Holliday junction resolvasome RuvABC ATP-dependent DNA helicase subunit
LAVYEKKALPHGHDLEHKSCLNNEVKMFNRIFKEIMKVCRTSRIIELESERDSFTKHGLHMNSRGKEQIAKRIVKAMLDMWREKRSDPITMKGTDEQDSFHQQMYPWRQVGREMVDPGTCGSFDFH